MKKRRAFTCFIEDKPQFILQVNHFFIASFEELNLQEDSDVLVFGPLEALSKVKDAEYIKKIMYYPPSYQPEYYNYHYANSITYAADNPTILGEYEYVVKTDADVFFMPAIKNFYPEVFTTGNGHYTNVEVKEKLRLEASRFDLTYREYYNLGATWYGKSEDVIAAAKLAKTIMLDLLKTYFSKNWGEWPHWYGGVSSMYASDLAINHLFDNVNVSNLIDYHSVGDDSVNKILIAHCFHTENIFSKFVFEQLHNSPYAQIDIYKLDLNVVNNYCLYIAEKSRRNSRE